MPPLSRARPPLKGSNLEAVAWLLLSLLGHWCRLRSEWVLQYTRLQPRHQTSQPFSHREPALHWPPLKI